VSELASEPFDAAASRMLTTIAGEEDA
jgi:hypothetical protein